VRIEKLRAERTLRRLYLALLAFGVLVCLAMLAPTHLPSP
jgi:hypothetical protein